MKSLTQVLTGQISENYDNDPQALRDKFPRGVFPYEYEKKVVDPHDRQRLTSLAQKAAFHYNMATKGQFSALDDEDRAYHHEKGRREGKKFVDAAKEFTTKYHDHPLSRYEHEVANGRYGEEGDHGAAYAYCDYKGIKIPNG